jgi:hypothetical protein
MTYAAVKNLADTRFRASNLKPRYYPSIGLLRDCRVDPFFSLLQRRLFSPQQHGFHPLPKTP